MGTRETRTGLRKVVLQREPNRWGLGFGLVVNGTLIFTKGANVVPFGSFPNRDTPDRYRHFLVAARDSNINMARLWGAATMKPVRSTTCATNSA